MRAPIALAALGALAISIPAIGMSGNWYAAQAKKELRECVQSESGGNWEVNSSTHVVSSCFAGGFITQVDFWKEYKCTPNQPCPRVASFLVASAQFGCEDDLMWAECYTEGFCNYDGGVYSVGESFPDADNCNTCSCSEGGLVACTERACIEL